MHNRKKLSTSPTEAETSASRAKYAAYQQLVTVLLEAKQKKDYSTETFALTSKILKLNPDFYTFWNYRREIILSNLKSPDANRNEIRDEELDLSCEGIKKNPKACKFHLNQATFHVRC